VAREAHDFVAGRDDLPGACRYGRTGFGQQHVPWLPLDQLHAEVVLELAQLCRQRRLADEAGSRGTAEVACFSQPGEVAQVLELQLCHRPPFGLSIEIIESIKYDSRRRAVVQILLVEDDSEAAGHLSHALREAGYEVKHCSDGAAGLAEARAARYDLLI